MTPREIAIKNIAESVLGSWVSPGVRELYDVKRAAAEWSQIIYDAFIEKPNQPTVGSSND